MRVFLAAVMIASLAGPAFAQEKPIAKYGEQSTKSPQEIAAEKEADLAYKRSLGNIPDKGPTDPWGNVRSDAAPKPVTKAAHGEAGQGRWRGEVEVAELPPGDQANADQIAYWNGPGGQRWADRQASQDIVLAPVAES